MVKKYGQSYFDRMGYEQVVATGATTRRSSTRPRSTGTRCRDGKVEDLPSPEAGPENFMGRMKFMFPNKFGVYLHDNPRRELFQKRSATTAAAASGSRMRRGSANGCSATTSTGSRPASEQPVMLAKPVPVYITYLTAMPQDGGTIAYYKDEYGRDTAQLATQSSSTGGTAAGH